MALSKNWTLRVGKNLTAEIKDAYCKVTGISGDKTQIAVNVGIYEKADDLEMASFFSCAFTPLLDGSNFLAQAYEHLKTLPEFSNAKDS
jgi:hypothetical protein